MRRTRSYLKPGLVKTKAPKGTVKTATQLYDDLFKHYQRKRPAPSRRGRP